jgi:hypothetical protein
MGIFYKEGEVDDNGVQEVCLKTSSGIELLGQKNSVASIPVTLAVDQSPLSTHIVGSGILEVNPDGSINVQGISVTVPTAANIAEFVKNNKVYSFCADVNLAQSGTHNPLVLISNPVGSGKVLYLYKLAFGVRVANVLGQFDFYIDPTVMANGTIYTPVNNNVGGGSSASSMLIYILPTISNLGTQIQAFIIGQNSNSFVSLEDCSIFIQPGHKFLLTGDPGSNNRLAAISITWAEV